MRRKIIQHILSDLDKKMVFITGPRQVGKTWLAKEIGKRFVNTVYLNYDNIDDRLIIKKMQWPKKTELLILDELHKMAGWKNYLKGVYDTKESDLRILVTGSARMDTFRKAGDSLLGRYFVHHLLPFSLSELNGTEYQGEIDRLIKRGGFPESFLAVNDSDADRWRALYVDGVIRIDVLDFENIHNFQAMKMVFELLRRKVGSPISVNSIAEDVQLSPLTVKRYLGIFEALYITFRISPFSKNIARSLLKNSKIYFFDNGLVVGDKGAEFENFVAVSLLKHVYERNDKMGKNLDLKYLRTKDGREADFALVKDGTIDLLLEAKYSESEIDTNLKYFTDKLSLNGLQVVKELRQEKTAGRINVVSAEKYLRGL